MAAGRSIAQAAVLVPAMMLVAGCDDATPEAGARPSPAELTGDAIGYYCNMIVVAHQGPKGHIFLTDRGEAIWFTSVRDTIAFTRLPEEPKNIAAIYVNDMGRASWDQPEPDTWTEAREAWYVVGSGKRGGMGAPEPVPFAEKEAAERFAVEEGGRVMRLDSIPDEAVLGSSVHPSGEDVVAARQSTRHVGHGDGDATGRARQWASVD